jgi:superfamily II helicase
MFTNCAPLLADLFLYSYEAEFIEKLLHEKNKPLDVAFNSIFRYIDEVSSINNNQLHSYVDSIIPSELEIKDTTESSTAASYLDVLLNIDTLGRLTTQLYDKLDDFNFAIVNFPYTCSNIPLSSAYGVYISLN